VSLMITGQKLIPSSERTQTLKSVRKIFRHSGLDPQSMLSLAFVRDSEIQALNLEWRGKNKPTDVLSFSAQEGEPMPGTEYLLGDILISVDTAQSQAERLGHSLHQELAVLFAHGFCHLTGYDHEKSAAEAKRQAGREFELLALVGISKQIVLTGRI
jgi:probable rRNA maturation factor